MGRHKSYNREVVLGRAMRLFWERGFHAASTRDLAQAMGINVYSLYAEFGSKEGLYEAALERYDRTVVAGHFSRLEQSEAGLDTVRAVLRSFAAAATPDNPLLGCLATNAMIEQAPSGPASRDQGAAYLERLTGAFRNALENAVAVGDLEPGAPVDALAGFLAASLLGVFVLLRSGGDPEVIRHTTDHALARVEAFTDRSGCLASGGG
jgi:TetR/AcrR family transcriptional repressor of nem operon